MKPVCFFATAVLLQIVCIQRESIKRVYITIGDRITSILGIVTKHTNESTKTSMDIYVEQQTGRFLKTYDYANTFNSNIDKCFYTKDALKESLIDTNNQLELKWKRRILYESTPRGNLIMHYDPYKMGFVYYSDTNTISQSLLNVAAMKYCLLYRCRDFFVDNGITPDNSHSALIPIHYIEPPNKKKDINDKLSGLDTNAFAKFKKYNKDIVTSKENNKLNIDATMKTMPNCDMCKNRFIYMGKMCNMNILQPVKKYTNSMNGFSSHHLDNLRGESNVQQHVLSYKDFKHNKLR